jgi:AcrR family transcriptional regulator
MSLAGTEGSALPAESRGTRERILDAAEHLFAEHGFDGVSMRAIAAEARAQLALIHYHFGSKEDLYRAVWDRRYDQTAELWRERAGGIDFDRPTEAVLRDVVANALCTVSAMKEPEGCSFAQIVAREAADPKEGARGVLSVHMDPQAKAVLSTLRRALPRLSDVELAWGYQFMQGVFLNHVCDVGRISRISDGAARSRDVDSALPHMIDFIVGGFMALDARHDGAASGSSQRSVILESA